MNRFASRKFLAAMATLASSTWALAEHLIPAGDYKAVVLGVVAAYIAGNVAQKAVEAPKT